MDTPARTFLLACLCDPLPIDRLRPAASQLADWPTLIALAQRHDLIPLLHRALDTLGEAVPADVRAEVRSRYAAEALRSLQLDSERRRLTELLLGSGIPVIPWKGPVLAADLYGDAALRPCADLDLLVPPEQVWAALQLLWAEGYDPGFPVPERRWPALRRAVNHLALVHSEHGRLVELHWVIFHPLHVWTFDLSAHWRALTDSDGAREGRLGGEETLVLLCAHGARHLWEKLKWVVDIDRLVRRHPALDWGGALELADRMGTRRALLLGLLLARAACGTPLPGSLSARLSGDAHVERLAGERKSAWFAAPAGSGLLREARFHLQCRERRRDRILWILRQLFAPRQADWQLFPLGSRCYPLFYLERPLRMVWKWGVRPVFGRRGSDER